MFSNQHLSTSPPQVSGSEDDAAADPPTLNPRNLQTLHSLRPRQAELLIQTFASSTRQRVISLHEAITASDLEQVKAIAHSLKGSCAMIGALRLAQLCQRLERAIDDGHLDPVGQRRIVVRFEQAFEEILQVLELEFRVDPCPADHG